MTKQKTLDIITVTKNDDFNLECTYKSIENLFKYGNVKITWIIVDSGTNFQSADLYTRISSNMEIKLKYHNNPSLDIYQAMNFGLTQVASDFFMMVNSGDLIDENILNYLDDLPSGQVSCFQSAWHSPELQNLNYRRKYRVSKRFARMPNHQAMIFPMEFKNETYNTKFKVSADQDLKIRLVRESKLTFRTEIIVSSLVGGISNRRMGIREAFSRSIETKSILVTHYNFAWAILLSCIYSLKYFSRVDIKQIFLKDYK
jgi:hypothetical protein